MTEATAPDWGEYRHGGRVSARTARALPKSVVKDLRPRVVLDLDGRLHFEEDGSVYDDVGVEVTDDLPSIRHKQRRSTLAAEETHKQRI